MIPEMTFEEARPLIKNGDAINIYKTDGWDLNTFLYGIINFMTGSPIYHVVVAMWMTTPNGTQRLMCVEANLLGGKQIVPLSIYRRRRMEIMPWPTVYSFSRMEEKLIDRVATQPYGLLNFVVIGLREFFGIKKPAKSICKGQVCSELVSEAWIEGGFPFNATVVSPGKLKGEMMRLGVLPSIVILPIT